MLDLSALPERTAYEFVWGAAVERYEWWSVVDEGRTRRALIWEAEVGNRLPPDKWLVKPYRPLQRRTLHRIFARTKPTEEGILRFANKYGSLTDGEKRSFYGEGPGGKVGFWKVEPFDLWRRHIAQMGAYLELWDLVVASRGDELARRYVTWNSRDQIAYVELTYAGGKDFAQYTKEHPVVQQWGKRRERDKESSAAEHFALYFVHSRVNQLLRGNVSPVVLPFQGGDMVFVPENLIAALWFLFALEIGGKPRPARICASCGQPFIPMHGKMRYCSQACRQAAYEARRRAAA